MKMIKPEFPEVVLDENIYFEEAVEELLDEDELTSPEAGFMHGYDEAG